MPDTATPADANTTTTASASASAAASAPVVSTEEELLRTAPLPHERVVYWGSGSPQAWRVLIALEEKRIPYRSVCVSFSSGVLKSPFFRALNPRMRVPVLVEPVDAAAAVAAAAVNPPAGGGASDADAAAPSGAKGGASGSPEVAAIAHGISHLLSVPHDRVVVYESTAILEFLERRFPQPALLPASLPLFALAQSRMHEANEILSVVGDLVVYLRRFPREQRSAGAVASKWATLEAELALWESYLGSRAFLLDADAPFLCDFTLFTNVAYAVRCGLQLDGLYPRLAVFYARLAARASVRDTWPPHWRASPGSTVLAKCFHCLGKPDCVCGGSTPSSVSPPHSQS